MLLCLNLFLQRCTTFSTPLKFHRQSNTQRRWRTISWSFSKCLWRDFKESIESMQREGDEKTVADNRMASKLPKVVFPAGFRCWLKCWTNRDSSRFDDVFINKLGNIFNSINLLRDCICCCSWFTSSVWPLFGIHGYVEACNKIKPRDFWCKFNLF